MRVYGIFVSKKAAKAWTVAERKRGHDLPTLAYGYTLVDGRKRAVAYDPLGTPGPREQGLDKPSTRGKVKSQLGGDLAGGKGRPRDTPSTGKASQGGSVTAAPQGEWVVDQKTGDMKYRYVA